MRFTFGRIIALVLVMNNHEENRWNTKFRIEIEILRRNIIKTMQLSDCVTAQTDQCLCRSHERKTWFLWRV